MTSSARAQRIAELTVEAARLECLVKALKEDDPGLELDDAACRLMREKPAEFKDYSAALEYVLKSDEALASRYAASFGQHKLSPQQVRTFGMPDEGDADATDGPAMAGAEIDRLALKLQRENPGLSYKDAMQRVLDERPDLSKTYAGR